MNSPESLQAQVNSQWKLLIILILAGLIGSIGTNLFFYRLDSELKNQLSAQQNQISQVERNRLGLQSIIQDLQSFAVTHPDIKPILVKHGIEKSAVPAPSVQPVKK